MTDDERGGDDLEIGGDSSLTLCETYRRSRTKS
jgi:hypothetical protein